MIHFRAVGVISIPDEDEKDHPTFRSEAMDAFCPLGDRVFERGCGIKPQPQTVI
jgi:hypothetical protein